MSFGYSTAHRLIEPRDEADTFGQVTPHRIIHPRPVVPPFGTTESGDAFRQNAFVRLIVAPSHSKPYIPAGERFAWWNLLTGFLQPKSRETDKYDLYRWPKPLDCWTTTPRTQYTNTKMTYGSPGANAWSYDFAEGDQNLPTVEMVDVYGSYPTLFGKWRTILPDGNPRMNLVEMPVAEYNKPWCVATSDWPWARDEENPSHLPLRESFAVSMYHYAPPRLRDITLPKDNDVEWGGDNPGDGEYPGGWGQYSEPGTAGLVLENMAHCKITWGDCWTLLFTQAVESSKETEDEETFFVMAANPFTKVYLLKHFHGKWIRVPGGEWTLSLDDLGRHNGVDREFIVRVAHVANAMAIAFNDGDWHIIDPNAQVTFVEGEPGDWPGGEPGPGDWPKYEGPIGTKIPPEEGAVQGHALYRFNTPAAPVFISGRNMPLYCGVHHIDFARNAMAEIWMRGASPLGPAPIARSWGYLPINEGSRDCTLHTVPGTDEILVSVGIEIDEETGDSPAVYGVSAHWEPDWVIPDSPTLDWGFAVVQADLHMNQPRDIGSTRLTVELDVNILDEWTAETGIDWTEYIQQWSPVRWYVGWLEDEGDPANPVGHQRLHGIIRNVRRGSEGYNRDNIVLEVWDWATGTMTDPAGVIDASYGPLDWAPEAREAHMAGNLYYAYQGIRTILQRATGLGHLQRTLLPPNHYGLIFGYYERRGQTPNAGDGMAIWMPPWGSYPIDWLRQLTTYDGMVFFARGDYFYYLDLNTYFHGDVPAGWPAPATHDCWDWVYVGGVRQEDRVESAIQSITAEKRAEESIVTVDVWGLKPGTQLYGIGRKCIDWEAIAPDIGGWTKPANYTGLETGIALKGAEFALEDLCTAVCRRVFAAFQGREPLRVRLKTQGQPTWWWGDEIVLHGNQAGQDGKTVRIIGMDEHFEKRTKAYTTTIVGTPDPHGS